MQGERAEYRRWLQDPEVAPGSAQPPGVAHRGGSPLPLPSSLVQVFPSLALPGFLDACNTQVEPTAHKPWTHSSKKTRGFRPVLGFEPKHVELTWLVVVSFKGKQPN